MDLSSSAVPCCCTDAKNNIGYWSPLTVLLVMRGSVTLMPIYIQ